MKTSSDSLKNIGRIVIDDGTGELTSDSNKLIGTFKIDDGTARKTSDSPKVIGRVRVWDGSSPVIKTSDSDLLRGCVTIDDGTGIKTSDSRKVRGTVILQGYSGGGPSFLINEGFEGVGAPPSWTPYNQPPDWDYSVSPLSGLQSLRMSSGISSGNNYQGLGYPTYPQGPDYGTVLNHDELWFKFKLKLETMNTGGVFNFQVYSQDELSAMSFMLHTTGEFGIQDPNGDTGYESLAQTTDQMSVGVIYDVFLHVKTNDAGDASAEVSFTETGGIRPTSGPRYASVSAGLLVVAPLTEFFIYPQWGAIVLVDDFQVAG